MWQACTAVFNFSVRCVPFQALRVFFLSQFLLFYFVILQYVSSFLFYFICTNKEKEIFIVWSIKTKNQKSVKKTVQNYLRERIAANPPKFLGLKPRNVGHFYFKNDSND